jgi:HD-like signal output (HDOD) protein
MDASDTIVLDPGHPQARAEARAFAAELAAGLQGDQIDLPSLPEVALRIREALGRDDADFERLAELAGADPALAARLMRIGNSALFARGGLPPADLHAAIVRLGSRMVRNAAIAIAAEQVFIGYASRSLRPQLEAVWRHSLHVAALSHLLLTVKRCPIPPDEGFLAGLLHEVGMLFILLRAKDREDLRRDRDALGAVIDEWQARVGGRIMEQWGFDGALVAAVRDHDRCPLDCGVPISLTEVVAVADYLSMRSAETSDIDALIAELPDFGSLRLDDDSIQFVLETATAEAGSLSAALGPDTRLQPKTASSA